MLLHHGAATVRLTLDPSHEPAVTAKLDGKVIWSGIHRHWKPWKLLEADVDGDGNEDFVVALYMHTRHAPRRIHTLFVYGFNGTEIYPKWRGSRMARDFVSVAVQKHKGGDKILTLDRLLNGDLALSCYAWDGFGFRKEWERGHWKSARIDRVESNRVTVRTGSGVETIELKEHL